MIIVWAGAVGQGRSAAWGLAGPAQVARVLHDCAVIFGNEFRKRTHYSYILLYSYTFFSFFGEARNSRLAIAEPLNRRDAHARRGRALAKMFPAEALASRAHATEREEWDFLGFATLFYFFCHVRRLTSAGCYVQPLTVRRG